MPRVGRTLLSAAFDFGVNRADQTKFKSGRQECPPHPRNSEVTTLLQLGEMAPDFDLPVLDGGVRKQFRLSEHRGKRNLVLAFYPANREPVSAQQMVNYQVEREQFLAQQAEVLGVNVDSIMNTTSWER